MIENPPLCACQGTCGTDITRHLSAVPNGQLVGYGEFFNESLSVNVRYGYDQYLTTSAGTTTKIFSYRCCQFAVSLRSEARGVRVLQHCRLLPQWCRRFNLIQAEMHGQTCIYTHQFQAAESKGAAVSYTERPFRGRDEWFHA
jgi:hypothetical protein